MTPETLRKLLRQAEVDEGTSAGTSTAESAQVRELKRKNRELEQTILWASWAYFIAIGPGAGRSIAGACCFGFVGVVPSKRP